MVISIIFLTLAIIASILSVALVFTISTSSFAADLNGAFNSQTTTRAKSLTTSQGDYLGEVTISTTTEIVSKKKSEIVYMITETRDYELDNKYASIPEYASKFSDKTTVDTYRFLNDGSIYLNGNPFELDLNANVSNLIQPMSDTGGYSQFCHYYDASDYTNYYFACYDDMSFTGVGDFQAVPTGNHVSKNTTVSNTYFMPAKVTVDSFKDNMSDFVLNYASLILTLGVAAVTWETILGVIASGTAAAILAVNVVNNWNDAEHDLEDAYGYISNM